VLVEPGSVESLAGGIIRAASNDYDLAPPKSFSWAAMIDGYVSLYRDLMKKE
jgi:hypothetical protein